MLQSIFIDRQRTKLRKYAILGQHKKIMRVNNRHIKVFKVHLLESIYNNTHHEELISRELKIEIYYKTYSPVQNSSFGPGHIAILEWSSSHMPICKKKPIRKCRSCIRCARKQLTRQLTESLGNDTSIVVVLAPTSDMCMTRNPKTLKANARFKTVETANTD